MPNSSILEFQNKSYSNCVDWCIIENPYYRKNSAKDKSYLLERYGHLALTNDKQIIMFGGEKGKEVRPS